jgi:DMSO/TMAO reductase YedYZ molybdopterin-dependent catalytic subunit
MAPMGRGKVYREPVQRYSQYSIWLNFNQRYKQQLPSLKRTKERTALQSRLEFFTRRNLLLATHFNGQPLTVDHGAPLRLLVPVKLGLKNVKAITKITYSAEEPRDYWAERGYSRYDGI